MQNPWFVTVILASSWAAHAADFAPALQWVKTAGGSGNSSVASAAADAQGNLYIVGATTSLDFPTTAATQAAAGGSMLVRINLATASALRLFPANLPPISSAAAAPANPGTLYAASGNQVSKSTDAGSTWTVISELPSGVRVSGLAVDPTTSSTVYAATSTMGIYKSVDGGLTWTAINNGIPRLPDNSINVAGVWVEPIAPYTIFASGGFGLVRSTDGGNTWTLVVGGFSYSILVFDPLTAGTLYFVFGNAISKSTDDGETFDRLSALPDQVTLFTLAPDPHHAGVLYAGTSAGVYQSSDGGRTWSLKLAGVTTVLVADPNSPAFYANLSSYGIVKSTDGFATTSPIGPNEPSVVQLVVSGSNLFEISATTTDAFAVKLDSNGNVVYSTYFGGSGNDAAAALAVGPDGSLYVTGSTTSADLPVTAGAYLSKLPSIHGGASSFVLKLNPDGSLDWATYFTERLVASIAVDSKGNPFVGGATGGGLPTTPGAYQTTFQQSVTSNGFFGVIGPTAAFVTKFNAKGTGLIYSTYVSTDNQKNTVEGAQALVVDAAGNVWIGVSVNPGIVPSVSTVPSVVELNPTGSAVLASAVQAGLGSVAALALDSNSNVYVAGSYSSQNIRFPATPGAFQSAPQPAIPALPYQAPSGGGQDAFVAKWDSGLTHLLAATLLGGELPDTATSVAVDGSGTVIVGGYTGSRAFPTHAPFQTSFSAPSGFVAAFDSNLSNLLFSTYLGDGRPFTAQAAVPDGNGNILVVGSTLSPGGTFVGGDIGASFTVGNLVVVNKIALSPAPAVRLDSVQNYASHLAAPLGPGEPIVALGAGFGNGAQIVVDGSPLVTVSATATSIVAVLPDTTATSGVRTLQVSSSGALSNSVYAPAAAASPAIYSVDGSGAGQAYILNSDGTLNSPSNPAATGSAVTIFAAGAGRYILSNGYAVTEQTPAVFIDGFYCNGIAATIGPVNGLPGDVFQLSMFVPDPATLAKNNPDLKNFKFPSQSAIQLVMGPPNSLSFVSSPMVSQNGIFINIK
ncbi:MAG TPA: SBBP repeat-containing protein [Bryobacteraceae bacterium]|nr:SBBP repeat-containing protein [Bryobacteraceae bacterium]